MTLPSTKLRRALTAGMAALALVTGATPAAASPSSWPRHERTSPQLEELDDGMALLYWDSSPEGAGVFVRKLDAAGSIAGPPIPVSPSGERQIFPTLMREPNGKLLKRALRA